MSLDLKKTEFALKKKIKELNNIKIGSTSYQIGLIITKLRTIRDNQIDIQCVEGDNCICEVFDSLIDKLLIIKEKFQT